MKEELTGNTRTYKGVEQVQVRTWGRDFGAFKYEWHYTWRDKETTNETNRLD